MIKIIEKAKKRRTKGGKYVMICTNEQEGHNVFIFFYFHKFITEVIINKDV